MIDPSLTDVWRRRVVAALIDLTLTLAVLASLVWLQVERFTRDSGGFFPPADLDRMAALSRTINRYAEIGDTRYVLAGAELVMTLIVTALTALTIYVLVPGGTGTSPGKRLLGLRVVTTRGDVVDVTQALTRTLVGLVDALPLVVPWAVGAAVARRSPLRQRLGDRVAGTAVVDARRPLRLARAGTEPDEEAADGPAEESAEGSVGDVPPVLPEPAAVAPLSSASGSDQDLQETSADALFVQHNEPTGTRDPDRRVPPPQHRGGWDPGGQPDQGWERPRAEPAPVWDPATLAEWLGPIAALSAGRPTPSHDGSPRRRAEDPPAEPESPPAPDPGTGDHVAGEPAPAQPVPAAPMPRTGAGTDPDEVPAPGPAAAATTVAQPGSLTSSGRPATTPTADGSTEEPVWNEDWQAWLYFDRTSGRWHRHDTASGAWEPIS